MNVKKGSFTVEAAFIIPLIVTVLAVLIGYAYFTHQRVWCTGAVYESMLYASGKRNSTEETSDTAAAHLTERINEAPLAAGTVTGSIGDNTFEISGKCSFSILEEVFGSLFISEVSGKMIKTDPVLIKRLEWFGGKTGED